MMDDSFSFEPVKLNAGSDPTKAGTKEEEEEEGVLGKRHRNSNGDAAQDVKAPTQHQQPSKKPKVEDPVAKAERRRILEEKKRLLADVEKELAKISQKSPSLPSAGGSLPGPKYSASAPTTPMLSSSTPLPAGRGAAASNRGRGAGRGARGGAAKSTPARAITPPEAIVELDEPAALSSLSHSTGTATPLSSSSDHLAPGGARGKRKSPSSSSAGIPRRASHDVSTLPTSPTPEGPVTRAKRARRPKRLDTFGGPASLSWALKQCQVLLKTLMTHKFGWPFNQPVDPIALNIPDYFDVIKHPMDLGTIKEQLDSGSYETEEEFAEDVRLVFTNTFTYNQPGSDIVVMASTLSSLFNEKFEILKAKIEERGRDAPEGVEETLKELRDSMSSVQRELERIKKTPNGRAGRAGAAEDQRPMTFEEKKKLSHAINNLPSDNLGMVVKIIHERMPQLTSSGEEIEIDIDALNPATLRHLERYVRSVTQRGRRRGSRTPSLTSSTSSSNNVQNEPLAPQGTQQKIEDVERQIKALTEHQQALTQKGLARSSGETDLLLAAAEEKKKKRNNDDSDSSESETDGSDSSDSSDSETSDSESDSGSDSESTDSEAERKDAAAAAAPAAPPVVTTLPSDALAAGESSSETADATTAVVAGEVAAASAPSPATASAGEDEGTHSENGLGANKAGSAISFSFDPSLGTKESSILPAEVGNGDESLPQAAVAIDDAPPKSEAPKQVALKNVDAWSELSDDFEAPTGKPQSPPSLDKTWSQFQTKKMQDAIREKERLEKEERERKERERREEERKQEEERRRREHEEAEERRRREVEEAELNAQRERERQRQAERMARERGELSMMEQSLLMASFEQQAAPVLPLFQYKSLDDVEADFGDLDAQPTMDGEEDGDNEHNRAAGSYGSNSGRGSSGGDGEVDNGEATETEEGAEMELSPTAPLPVPASDEMEEGQI